MVKVVTVAREYGSGGAIIARMVAERLGWNLLDGALIGAIARTAEVDTNIAGRYDEHVDSWWHRFNRGGLWSAAMMAGIAPDDVQFFDADTMADVYTAGHAEGCRKRRLRDRWPRSPMRVAVS